MASELGDKILFYATSVTVILFKLCKLILNILEKYVILQLLVFYLIVWLLDIQIFKHSKIGNFSNYYELVIHDNRDFKNSKIKDCAIASNNLSDIENLKEFKSLSKNDKIVVKTFFDKIKNTTIK